GDRAVGARPGGGDAAPAARRAGAGAGEVARRGARRPRLRDARARGASRAGGGLSTGCVLAIHGGAGTLSRAEATPRRESTYRAALERSLRAGYTVLRSGGSAVDAVVATVVRIGDSPLLQPGQGAGHHAQRPP